MDGCRNGYEVKEIFLTKLRTALKEAARVFVLSRLFIVFISIVGFFLLPQFFPVLKHALASTIYSDDPHRLKAFFFCWFHWDTIHFVNISYAGYTDTQNVAFFPLWPLSQRYVGLLLGGFFPGSYYMGGILLSNICFYFALVLLYRLFVEDFDSGVAKRALLYLAFAPYALFFFAGYTESLFVLLCVGSFLLLRRGKPLDWWLAGLLGFLATLTRSTGVVLAIPFLIMYAQHFWTPNERNRHSWRQKLNALAPIILVPLGTLVYTLYLYYTKGSLSIIKMEEESTWHRSFSFPWDTTILVIRTLISAPMSGDVAVNLIFFSFVCVTLGVLVLGWRRIPLDYRLFSLALAALALSFPARTHNPLYSQPRYLMVIFPIYVILAMWGKHSSFHRGFMLLSLALCVQNTIYFVDNFWVV